MYSGKQELDDNSKWLRTYNGDIAGLLYSSTQYLRRPPSASNKADEKMRILDFGAGIGTITRLIRERNVCHEYFCVELDPHLKSCLPDWSISSTHLLDEWRGTMDLVVTSNVIEHINDDVEIMRQLHGVLSDYGVISVYVPAIPFLWTRMDDNVGHYRRYTITSLRKILESSGFSVKEIRYVDSVGGIATLFFRLKELMSRSNSYKPPSEGLLRFYDRYIWPASRIMDLIMNQYFGKNILAIASK